MSERSGYKLIVVLAVFITFASVLIIISSDLSANKTMYSVHGPEPENGTVEGYGDYSRGTYVTLIATPDAGYEFRGWYDEVQGYKISGYNQHSFIVYDDKNITAVFEKVKFNIRVNVTGEAEITGAGSYFFGDSVSLYVTPDENYTFSHWEHKGVIIEEQTYTFVVETGASIRCVLIGDPCNITVIPGNHIETATLSGTYEYGSSIRLSATAEEDYVVDAWKSEGETLGHGSQIFYKVQGDAIIHVTAKLDLDAAFTMTQTGYNEPYSFTCKSNDSSAYTNTWSAEGTGVRINSSYREEEYSMDLNCVFNKGIGGAWNIEIRYPNSIKVEDMRPVTISHTVACGGYEETVSNTYSAYGWKFQFKNHSLFLEMDSRDYADAKRFSDQWNRNYDYYYRSSSLWNGIVIQNSTVKSVAYSLDAITFGMTQREKAQCILDFVTYTVNYTSDRTLYGQEEYFATAYGTLYLRKGDCEDSSILFVSLASYCGLPTYLISPPGHMAGGVMLSDTGGNFSAHPGLYYCETTSKGAKAGYIPPSYSGVMCTLERVSVYSY